MIFRNHFDDRDAARSRAETGPATVPPTHTKPRLLTAEQSIGQWLYTDPQIERLQGPLRPNPDRVDYRFVDADTGISPARQALAARPDPVDRPMPRGPFRNLYVQSSSPNVDFSAFAYVPLLIRRALLCRLHSDGGPARFRLTTCGAIRLWLGETLTHTFAPWSANFEQSCEVTLDLPPGATDLTVELEELHERNTVNCLAVRWLSGAAVSCSVPATEPERLEDAAAVVDELDCDRLWFEDGPLSLALARAPRFELSLEVLSIGQMPRNHCLEWLEIPAFSLTLMPGQTNAAFPAIDPLPTGCSDIWTCATVGGIRIPRRLGTTILTRGVPLEGQSVAARKAEALRLAVRDTGCEISVAMVQLAQGIFTDRTRRILEEALHLIEQRHDCADFALLPALRIWRDHRDRLPADLARRLRTAILGFRFWMSEPGNDAMWFWSENHALCFHIAQFIAGHLFPQDVFPNSGQLGETHEAEARQRLYRWFDAIERNGLCEWNSAAYYPIDIFALLTLHDLSPDDELTRRAARLLDRIFVMTALHMTGGVPAGTQGRAYEKELLSGPINELAVVAAIAFGGTYYPGQGRAAFSFCLSDYAPPPVATRLARPADGEVIEAAYHQGHGRLGKLTLWKTATAQLSTVSDHLTGQQGVQQHVIDVQLAGHPMARLWINHPGDRRPWSERRPSRLAGNHWLPRVAQHERHAFLIYDLPEDEPYIPWTHVFAITPAFDEVHRFERGVLLRSGPCYASVWCSAPLEVETAGACRGAIFRAKTRKVAWAVAVTTPRAPAEVAHLHDAMASHLLAFDPEALRLTFRTYILDYRSGRFTHAGGEVRHGQDTPVAHISVDRGGFVPWTKLPEGPEA